LLQKLGFQTAIGMEILYFFRSINTKLDYKVKNYDVDVDFKKNQMPFLWLWWVKIACQKSNYQFFVKYYRYFLDTCTLSYLGIGCQIESIMNGDLKIKMGKS